jgi:formylglycine-generating enzyme required for sulfatase activity
MLRPGSHRVAAQLEGYYPFSAEFTVGREQGQSVKFELVRLPGLVTLTTSPSTTADVMLDGAPFGSTPLTDVEITPGLHRLEFAAERYLTEVRELTVDGGGARQSLTVPLTPNWAPVRLVTEPAGAEVLVDGAPAGTTPIALELSAGQRELEVRLSGYNAWRDSIAVNANEPQELPLVKLTQADGRVELVSIPSEASVSVDGQFLGRTPLSVRLTPGRPHQITLAKPGYAQSTQQLSVAADSGRRVQIELVAQLGDVEVQSDPPNAEIWVDGARVNATPARLTLSAIEHTIEVRQAGYATASAQITPRPGFPQQLPFTLVPLDDTSGSGYAQTVRTKAGQELKLIPAGQFLMGTSRREPNRRSNEILRPVKISRAFYLGVREVTNAELRLFLREHDSGDYQGQSLNDDQQPAVNVSWNDAARYTNWLSQQEGLDPVYDESRGTWIPARPLRNGYRLPTEAEWEWAARAAGEETPLLYPWGAALPLPDRSGNYGDLTAKAILPTVLVTYTDGFAVSAPPGTFAANAVGLFDLGGNVAEWVQDYYSIAVASVAEGELIQDPLGDETGDFHVVRGSTWRSATVTDLRLAYRGYSEDARDDVGFRLARSLP